MGGDNCRECSPLDRFTEARFCGLPRRGRGPADTRARAKLVLEAAQAAIAYGQEIGLVEDA
ncbi:hypothetical protein SynMEDNS5_01792 [Synechococcus sp. MEDNS5]|uniref:hypothetical protein n=1 Tax=Synechococcus sp. MEDNS5 TaxID=1442554 RepID=UPI001646163E|nr:hypothetical protein [Synechococcus sp. MEDNS5]QNJ06507.1 hypothetical protein SynMEDNS5_01792 [Synechococcus sp. MEDNS5]